MNPKDQAGFYIYITQEMIAPGSIKQRHLVPSPVGKGDIYIGGNGGNFTSVSIGTPGQVLMVVAGIPTWINFPATALAANRPLSGRFVGDQFYATDSFVLSLWNGSAWKSTTLG